MESGLRDLLNRVRSGRLSIDEALETFKNLFYEDLGYAKLDHHRTIRKGFPEVVYCAGKTPAQAAEIVRRLREKSPTVMGTRADAATFSAIKSVCPDAIYYKEARIVLVGHKPEPSDGQGYVAVLTAGTSDIPIAEEAAVTAEAMGVAVERLFDVGVAGIHRLFGKREIIDGAAAVVVVAGMDGALASVVGGLVAAPVIAVPTSVGYGASFNGLSALLTMLNACAPGIAVVNIDNGFGGGYMAALVARNARRKPAGPGPGDAVSPTSEGETKGSGEMENEDSVH